MVPYARQSWFQLGRQIDEKKNKNKKNKKKYNASKFKNQQIQMFSTISLNVTAIVTVVMMALLCVEDSQGLIAPLFSFFERLLTSTTVASKTHLHTKTLLVKKMQAWTVNPARHGPSVFIKQTALWVQQYPDPRPSCKNTFNSVFHPMFWRGAFIYSIQYLSVKKEHLSVVAQCNKYPEILLLPKYPLSTISIYCLCFLWPLVRPLLSPKDRLLPRQPMTDGWGHNA